MKKIKKDKIYTFIIQSRGYGKSYFEKFLKEKEKNEKISNWWSFWFID